MIYPCIQSNANIWCENRTWHVYTYLNVIHPFFSPFSLLFPFSLSSCIVTFPLRTTYETIYVFWSITRPTCARGLYANPIVEELAEGSSLPPSRYFFRATLFQPFSDSNRKIVSCLIVKLMAAPRVRWGAHCNFEISSQINFPTETYAYLYTFAGGLKSLKHRQRAMWLSVWMIFENFPIYFIFNF